MKSHMERLCALVAVLFASTALAVSPFDRVREPDALAPAMAYRPVGSDIGYRGRATGFFHVEEDAAGRYWAVDPVGRGVWLAGVEHVRSKGWFCAALGYSPYGRFVETNYPSLDAWAEETTGRLASWGFAVASGEVQPELRHRAVAHTPTLNISDQFGYASQEWWIAQNKRCPGSQFPNVFHPDFGRFCDHFARYRVAPHKDDPWLAGWFLDNELAWHGGAADPACGLFDRAMALPPNHSAHIAAKQFVKGNTITRELKRQFLLLCAERYFSTITAALRRHDPNHLILGCRFAGWERGVGDPDVWSIAGKYCDVVSFNWYAWADLAGNVILDRRGGIPATERLREIHGRCGKPLLITEWSFPALDTGRPCYFGAGQRYATQEGRVAASSLFARTLIASPCVVGYDYFMWYDQPAGGASNKAFPEDTNYGLVSEFGVPYDGLVGMFSEVHGKAGKLHADVVGFRQEADGSWSLSNSLVCVSGGIGRRDMASGISWGADAPPVARWGGALLEWETPDGAVHYTDVSSLESVDFSRDDATGIGSVVLRASGFAGYSRDAASPSAPGERPLHFAVTHRLSLAPGFGDIRAELVSIENLGEEPLLVRDTMMRPFALGSEPPKCLPRVPNRADGLVEAGWGLADGSGLWLSTHDMAAYAATFWLGDDGVQHPDMRFRAPGGTFEIACGAIWTPPVPMSARLSLK